MPNGTGVILWGTDETTGLPVKLICNSAGKLIIDPSEIFENPPTDGETAKAPQSAWAYDHDADPDAHHARLHTLQSASDHSGEISDAQHGVRTLANAHAHSALSGIGSSDHHVKYTDAEALAAAIAGGLSKFVWKDASQNALADLNRTVTLTWTDLDLTAYTSANAKIALVRLGIRPDVIGTGIYCGFYLRKNGTTPDDSPNITVDKAGVSVNGISNAFSLIGLDSGQILEYYILVGTGWQIDCWLDILGYIE